ncbi:hypothetical protein QKT50_gp135 [Rachiplusia ou multiple nucleopolyhedrovirus]|uniref:Uncharacterized protein n=1 Tax=Rachiplusia ou multiple nucleopolyhedrovirus (strain R1) TaxID=654904 RepID=Q8B9C2_NPVR1|nr:hypothetical protein QKT50_gp135 [Rachiplusia ou multiple nucleopolyhedrovirus]AAN28159.1 unknown [Rachiplusia ou multiple nucleopolyhedrovirus]
MAMTHNLTSLYFPGRSARDCWFLSCCVARYQLLILCDAQASVCAGAQLILIYELGKRALYSLSPSTTLVPCAKCLRDQALLRIYNFISLDKVSIYKASRWLNVHSTVLISECY